MLTQKAVKDLQGIKWLDIYNALAENATKEEKEILRKLVNKRRDELK